MYRVQILGFTLVVGFFAAFQAAATTITTTNYGTWSSSSYTTGGTGAQTVVDLASLNVGMSYSTAAGYSSNGYIFTGPDGSGYYLFAEDPNGTTGLEGKSDGVGVIQVAMPNAGNSAFFFDASCITCGSLSLTLSDGENFTVSDGQFGISISHDVTWFDLGTSSGTQPFLEYVYFGTSSLPPDSPAASEAATPVLVGGGLMLLVGAGRKKLFRRA